MNRQQLTSLMLGAVLCLTLNVQAGGGDVLRWVWSAGAEITDQIYPDYTQDLYTEVPSEQTDNN